MRAPASFAFGILVGVVLATVLAASAAEFPVQDEYADAKALADRIRQWEASPKRTLMLERFKVVETDYLPRAQRQHQITSVARKALDEHEARERDFHAKLKTIKSRSAEDTGPGSAWRAELAQVATTYSGYLKEWEPRRKELSAQLSAATAELEKSRAPLKEFQRIYHALYFRRVAYQSGMRWEQLVSAETLAFVVSRCSDADLLVTHGQKPVKIEEAASTVPLATLYRAKSGDEWVRRSDLAVPGMEAGVDVRPGTVVCVRRAEQTIGDYRLPSGVRLPAISVQWHVLLVRANDGALIGTKVLYGAPPADTVTVPSTVMQAIRGEEPTPGDLAEWLNRRIGAAAPAK